MNIAGLAAESSIYIRPSLCAYYKQLQYNGRILKRNGQIQAVLTSDDGAVKIKKLDGQYVKLTHETDLIQAFPQFKNFSFN